MPSSASAVRVCDATGKVVDPTRERAEARIRELRFNGLAKAGTFGAYVCGACGGWHHGHHSFAREVPGTLGEVLLAAGVRRG